jgi:hypothetical protein
MDDQRGLANKSDKFKSNNQLDKIYNLSGGDARITFVLQSILNYVVKAV